MISNRKVKRAARTEEADVLSKLHRLSSKSASSSSPSMLTTIMDSRQENKLEDILESIDFMESDINFWDQTELNIAATLRDDESPPNKAFAKNLYKLTAFQRKEKTRPSKIEFRLYKPSKLRYSRKKANKMIAKNRQFENVIDKHKSRKPVILNQNNNDTATEEGNINASKERTFEKPDTLEKGFPREDVEANSIFGRMRKSFQKFKKPDRSSGGKAFPKTDRVFSPPLANNRSDSLENIEVYFLDHGNSQYFRTTDCPPSLVSELLAQRTTYYATRFWAEIFGSIHIGVAFFVAFLLQAYRFMLYSIVRPITVGLLQITSDYFFKPLLAVVFNGVIQPPLTLLLNIFSSIRDTLVPISDALDNFMKPVARVFGAFNLISYETSPLLPIVRHDHKKEDNCKGLECL